MWLLWKRGCSKTRGELGFAEDGSRGCYEPFPTPVIFSTIVYCNFRTIERPRSPRVWINWCLWLPPKLHIIEEGSQPAIRLPSLSFFFFFFPLLFLFSSIPTLFVFQIPNPFLVPKSAPSTCLIKYHNPLSYFEDPSWGYFIKSVNSWKMSNISKSICLSKKKHPNWFQNNWFLCNELITNIVIL